MARHHYHHHHHHTAFICFNMLTYSNKTVDVPNFFLSSRQLEASMKAIRLAPSFSQMTADRVRVWHRLLSTKLMYNECVRRNIAQLRINILPLGFTCTLKAGWHHLSFSLSCKLAALIVHSNCVLWTQLFDKVVWTILRSNKKSFASHLSPPVLPYVTKISKTKSTPLPCTQKTILIVRYFLPFKKYMSTYRFNSVLLVW